MLVAESNCFVDCSTWIKKIIYDCKTVYNYIYKSSYYEHV